jgi:hypothetical protein
MKLIDAFDNKYPRSRELSEKKIQTKPRIAPHDLYLRASDEIPPEKRKRIKRNRTVGNDIRNI